MKKKGFFFTVTAILLLMLLLFATSMQLNNRLTQKTETVHVRVMTLNDFLKDAEKDIERGVYIAGFRAVLSAQEYISVEGLYIDNAKSDLTELMINGTLYGEQSDLMIDSTMEDWSTKLQEEGENIGVNFTFTLNEIRFYHSDPWTIAIDANVTLNLIDKKQTAQWKAEKVVTSYISIIGLEDPAYTVEGFGRVIINVNQTPFEDNYVSGANVSNLLSHTYEHYYTNSTGPSFLMRFEGNFSNSSSGIESLVDLNYFASQGLQVYERSIVDYVYFSELNTTNYRINDTPSWFRIDEGHLEKYQVTDLTS